MVHLRIEQGEAGSFEVELNKDEFTIGRGTVNDLHFRSPWLSRLHARIVRRQGRYYLSDADSRNGTFLNGEILREERDLCHGDVITLGELQLHFIDAAATPLRVSNVAVPLNTSGTVMIKSEELVFGRYRESPATAEIGQFDPAQSLMPALTSAASALISHYPLEELVELIMKLIFEAVVAERGALLLRSRAGDGDGELRMAAQRGYGEGEEVQISRTIVKEVLENQKAVLMLDAHTDERFDQAQSILLQGIRSIICVPLWNNREVIGLLYLDHRVTGQMFTENDLRLVGLIGNMAAVKIENVLLLEEQIEKKRMEEQLALGAKIQRGLLPAEIPQIPGYDLFGENQSCYEIGGDYYDFIPKGDGKLAVVIADISGKGVGAALLMAVLQASLRSLIHTAAEPAVLVEQLNRVLVESSPSNKFATLFYAELDPHTHTVEYVNGGHNPALVAAQGEVEELGSSGPIVGLIPEARFVSRRISLPPGGVLLLYTDGVTELTNAEGEEFETERLVELLRENRSADAGSLAQVLRDRMDDFCAAEGPEDDTTIVVVRRVS
ncbi:MAG: SpoIIE family protein phosphatase [bacterium]|nr:SpoIIE family protein phosphatase [bacterium]